MEETVNNFPAIAQLIMGLCTTGGVLYLLVKSFLDRKKTREEVKHQQAENVEKAVSYGIPMIQIYEEIHKIVTKETDPIKEQLVEANARIKVLEDNYCCYREVCDKRIRNERDVRKDAAKD